MVKLARGGRRQMLQGRPEPKPLFPPGKLPVFGPPPVNTRGPPIPRHQRQGYGPGPGMPHRPPPLMRPLPPMGPPLPPPPPPHRAGPPPLMGPHPPLPLMGGPPHGMMPRPPPHFMQGRRPLMRPRPGMGPPLKRLNKNFRKKQRRNKFDGGQKKNQKKNGIADDLLTGPWINDNIKAEIEKMNELKKVADEKKVESDIQAFKEQENKVKSMANAAKLEHIGSQPNIEESKDGDTKEEDKGGSEDKANSEVKAEEMQTDSGATESADTAATEPAGATEPAAAAPVAAAD